MRTAILSAILLSIALADITCTSSQVYLKVSKQSGASWASEESYEIYGNGAFIQVLLLLMVNYVLLNIA